MSALYFNKCRCVSACLRGRGSVVKMTSCPHCLMMSDDGRAASASRSECPARVMDVRTSFMGGCWLVGRLASQVESSQSRPRVGFGESGLWLHGWLVPSRHHRVRMTPNAKDVEWSSGRVVEWSRLCGKCMSSGSMDECVRACVRAYRKMMTHDDTVTRY